MKTVNVPASGARYWVALSIASVCGANIGDFVAKNLQLGHWSGLPPLVVMFLAVIAAERWGKIRGEFYYWIAILIMRTAATNLGDLLKHDFGLGFLWPIVGLTAIMVMLLAASPRPSRSEGVPDITPWYWGTMLTAGTLGTVGGDWVADVWGFGDVGAAIFLCSVLALIFCVREYATLTQRWSYWVTVVAIRAAGTSVGDSFAGRHGLALGLAISTSLTGLALVALLVGWRRQSTLSVAST